MSAIDPWPEDQPVPPVSTTGWHECLARRDHLAEQVARSGLLMAEYEELVRLRDGIGARLAVPTNPPEGPCPTT